MTTCFATGTVNVGGQRLCGRTYRQKACMEVVNHDTYATGFIVGGVNSTVGGLIGHNQGSVADLLFIRTPLQADRAMPWAD